MEGVPMGRIRKTRQQAWILAAVKSLRNHPTMEEVFEEVRRRHPKIGRATVYRNLLQFVEEGEIRSVAMPISPTRYDDKLAAHYHFKCRQCGDILDIDADLKDILEGSIRAPDGVLIDTHDIVFGGLCPRCNKEHEISNEGRQHGAEV